MSSPPHKRKVPPQNYKAPLLKTFWRRFWLQKIFSLAAKVWGICLLSVFILLRWWKLASVSIFCSYKPERWREVNQWQFISQGD